MSVLGKALQTSREIETRSTALPKGRDRAAKFLVLAFIISGLSACSTGTVSSVDPADGLASSSEVSTDASMPADETAAISPETTAGSEPATGFEPTTEEVAAANGMVPAETYTGEAAISDTTTSNTADLTGQVAAATAPAVLQSMSLEQKPNKPSYVVLSLTEPTSYHLSQTTSTEYVLTLSGATLETTAATAPQILPQGVPGIRSVRATQSGSSTMVRMFVDSGMTLSATETGPNMITVTSTPGMTAALTPVIDTDARAQLQPPTTEAAPAAGDEGKPAIQVKENENTARENPTGLVSSDGSKVYTGRLISLDLQDTDIDNALRIIAEVSNLNIIASDDVTGKVTLRLIDVPWDQALDVILKTNGLDQVTEGNVIRIAPIEKLRQEREALKEAKKAQEALEDLSVRYARISYARATELKEQVESVLSERGTVSVDERTNQLIIKDVKKGQTQASDLLKRLDLRTPQVLLETQIVESGRNILRDLGFQWSFTENHSPATGNATGLNFPNTFNLTGSNAPGTNEGVSFPAATSATEGFGITALLDSADGSRTIGARLSALERERAVKVISRPQVATVNNKQAEISSVETLRVRLPSAGTAISTGSGASASSGAATAFEEIKVGIELKVTPQASPDYFVLLDINAKSSTLGNRAVDNIPSTVDRTANSTVLIKSGQTFALGGVYRLNDSDSVVGVPFIKDIPFLGHFFRRTFFDKSDEELIFFITPHIVEGSFDAAAM